MAGYGANQLWLNIPINYNGQKKSSIPRKTTDFIEDTGEAIGDFFEDAGETVGGFLEDAGEAVGGFFEDAGNAIGEFFSGIFG